MRVALGMAGMLALAPAPGGGQTVTHGGAPSRIARAVELEKQAVSLHAQPARAADAARLHAESARLRDPGDPRAVQSLTVAAHLYGYARQPIVARRTMEEAAERALAMGDVLRAARAYTEAAFFAQKQGNSYEVNRLGGRAVLLANSPLLRADQRAAIRDRFRTKPAVATSVR